MWSAALKIAGKNLHVLLRQMSKVQFCMRWKGADKGHGTERGVSSGFV